MRIAIMLVGISLLTTATLPAMAEAPENGSFPLKLFQAIAKSKKDSNLLVSPYSVSSALEMTLNGAGGYTKTAMQDVLGLADRDIAEINQKATATRKSLNGVTKGTTLRAANALFGNALVKFDRRFLERCKSSYDARLASLSFGSPEATSSINNWVARKTEGKIPSIVDRTTPDAILYLINALYFKGEWQYAFNKSGTRSCSFSLPGGKTRNADIMHLRRDDFAYFRTPAFQAVNLFYNDKRLSLYLFLPNRNNTLENFELNMTQRGLNQWFKRFTRQKGFLGLPRFKIEDQISLVRPLSDLGMKIAFNSMEANFENMVKKSDSNVYLSKVIHKTFMEVNEKGTEAAAATAVLAKAKGLHVPSPEFRMIIDRPFFFLLRDNRTATILFMGHVTDPRSG